MRILITGARGQLGTDLQRSLAEHELIPCTHDELDVTEKHRVYGLVKDHRPDAVINTAAYHRVDECESHPDRTFAVNAFGPWHVAMACRMYGAKLVHVSTNFVFDGTSDRPYREDDLPMPLNVYGTAKLSGEHLVRSTWDRHFIIRTTGLFGHSGGGGKGYNFVEAMIRAGTERREVVVVGDQVMSPTGTADLARVLAELVTTDAFGTYHVTSAGACSYYDFARTIFRKTGIEAALKPTTTEAYGAPAARPLYTVLDNGRIRSLGIVEMPSWEDALDGYLARRALPDATDAPKAGRGDAQLAGPTGARGAHPSERGRRDATDETTGGNP